MPDEFDVSSSVPARPGENVAGRCADGGLSAAIVEGAAGRRASARSGGASRPRPCLRPGDVLAAARRVPGAAQAITGRLDVAAAFEQRDVHDVRLGRHRRASPGWTTTASPWCAVTAASPGRASVAVTAHGRGDPAPDGAPVAVAIAVGTERRHAPDRRPGRRPAVDQRGDHRATHTVPATAARPRGRGDRCWRWRRRSPASAAR